MKPGAILSIVALAACLAWFWNGRANVKKMSNPAVYFEIPVSDLDRPVRFYGPVIGYQFQRETIDHNEMALFPLHENSPGVSGALGKGEIYVPSKTGSLIYLHTSEIDLTLKRVAKAGGKTLYPKTSLGGLGFVAEFEDSEGNRVALHSRGK